MVSCAIKKNMSIAFDCEANEYHVVSNINNGDVHPANETGLIYTRSD